MGISRVGIWLRGVTNLLTESHDPPSSDVYGFQMACAHPLRKKKP